ncbi:MAG: chromosome segregation protein SMC [Gemmatimonadota bacterium]
MKLRALRLHGFKSFADRTELQFHDGITAVVGPNGCGKSNISDAIRWVLGEQRPAVIRGARMEEAIFQGTVHRRPVNRGSVTLVVSNDEGRLPVPFEEVEIGRTVYRDGGSDYSLNRSSCRLRDIQELCRDTGLGANAYAVIEGRMVDAILSDRAEERRGLFEEASGVGKYKDRRKAALRRLERAEMDLQRLEDVLGEVQTKVRSLSRQKGKAERYKELRARRLSLDVHRARTRMEGLAARQKELEKSLGHQQEDGPGVSAELAAAEAELQALRLRAVGVEQARGEVGRRGAAIRDALVKWERDLAVAGERSATAESRLNRLSQEREELDKRGGELAQQAQELHLLETEVQTRAEEFRARAETGRRELEGVRDRLGKARARVDEVESREREVARKSAQLEGDEAAARDQALELERRLAHLEMELGEASRSLDELRGQGDLFADEVGRVTSEVEATRNRVQASREALQEARDQWEVARAQERAASDRLGAVSARLEALERLERDREGTEPAVRAALVAHPTDVLGILADFLSGPAPVMRAVELHLGALTHALVVVDRAAAARVAEWFNGEWSGGGGLVLLPAQQFPGSGGDAAGPPPSGLEFREPGEGWLRHLVGGLEVGDTDSLEPSPQGRDRVRPDGISVDRHGMVRVGNPMGARGILERKEEIRALQKEVKELTRGLEEAREAVGRMQDDVKAAEGTVEASLADHRRAEDVLRKAQGEESARNDQQQRLDRRKADALRQVDATGTARERALQRAEEARSQREALLKEDDSLAEVRREAREALDQVQEEWEASRSRESALAVDQTRAEGELEAVRQKIRQMLEAQAGTTRRLEALAQEETALHAARQEAVSLQERGGHETDALFRERDTVQTEMRARDEALAEVQATVTRLDSRVRSLRIQEREATERRHALELESREVEGALERIRERLEGEWARPVEWLLKEVEPLEGDPEQLAEELKEVVAALERLGPVNMLAVEEHDEESARLSFLTEQRDDLTKARDDLRAAIREINHTATELFLETFHAIRDNFRETFQRLFQGGECDLWLGDPEDPLESAIEIHASPVGKRTQRIDLLSGGERALTALSLLFGIYLVKPSPFCVLDEVDAPLDESNIGRFIRLLQEFKEQTQFVVITHNPRTIEAADWIYGVTMEEPGVSSIVGVQLREALQVSTGVG